MRILLDENVDRRLKRFFGEEHQILSVPERGWAGTKNGELLALAQHEFDVLVTTDRSMPHQQDISRINLAVVVVEAKSNTLEDLTRLMNQVNASLADASTGEVVRISASGA